jgi:hypothetical protein
MVRVGEDVSEKLDIVPAEFFVHRHVHGKWACKCCQLLVQEAVAAQIIDGGVPASGLVAHTLISRFVDHLPYYRQEAINARSGVYTPRSTLAQWAARPARRSSASTTCTSASCSAPPCCTPTRRRWRCSIRGRQDQEGLRLGYARAFDPTPGVVYDFCLARRAVPDQVPGPPRG